MEATEKPRPTPEERRARKAARREKQRRQNGLRAAKMHQARLADPQASAAPVKSRAKGREFHIGCSGWFYWDWRERFYPAGMAPSGWFDHYRKRFRTVELNAPFYSWPTVATVKGWRRMIGRTRFVYTVKVSELITHVKRFEDTAELVRDFGYIADLLSPSMGCFLFQLPPSEHYSPEMLARIVGQLDPARRNVVEFRHASWWNETVYAAFREKGIAFCSCSGPRLPDELIETADDVYVRFHGVKAWYRYDYSKEELAVWAERIRRSHAKRVWVYFNNDYEGFAIKNARELARQLKHSAN